MTATVGRLVIERLPAYAPELNPVEYLWGHLKEHELGHLLVSQLHELSHHATAAPESSLPVGNNPTSLCDSVSLYCAL